MPGFASTGYYLHKIWKLLSGQGEDGVLTTIVTATPVASELHLGEVGGKTLTVDVTPTLTVAAAYVANDYVGTSGVAMVIAGAARLAAGSGVIQSVVLIDYALQSVSGEVWIFDTAVTPPADSAAWSISDADAARCVAVVPLSTYYASALNSVAKAENIGKGYKCLAASTSLYACFVTRGAPAYATGDLTFRFTFLPD